MEHKVEHTTIRLVKGDLTEQEVDAVVNAANSSLMGGGGVDGAIHSKGGPAIKEACEKIVAEQGELATGQAVVTTAGDLPARYVIHTVGPVWQDGYHGENTQLEFAYLHSLEKAKENEVRTVAFPAISTGAYGFPLEEGSFIAFGTVVRFVRENPEALDEVRLVLFSDEDYATYEKCFDEFVRTMLG